MEREFGSEMARVFGTRLKRIYEVEQTALPTSIALWLEHLKRAEADIAARPDAKPRREKPDCVAGRAPAVDNKG